jgi:nucleotide-binding universal stress UspA family protein
MYKRIVVPLDGSPAAECVIDHVRTIAARGSEVILVQAALTPHFDFVVPEPELAACLDTEIAEEARDYLAGVARRLAGPGITVSTCVLAEHGPVPSLIAEFARRSNADLVVISAHGRSGIIGRLMGTVAEKLIHEAGVPVLIVHPSPTQRL